MVYKTEFKLLSILCFIKYITRLVLAILILGEFDAKNNDVVTSDSFQFDIC